MAQKEVKSQPSAKFVSVAANADYLNVKLNQAPTSSTRKIAMID
jgi:hypothetical protein